MKTLIAEVKVDITGIARLSSSIAETGTKQEVEFAILKRAQQIQASTATQLIDAIQPAPTAAAASLPPNLGRNINTTA